MSRQVRLAPCTECSARRLPRGGTRNEVIEATLETGTYYVRVVAREAGENAYNLRYRAADPEPVAEPEGQDFAADTSTLGRVAVGGSVTGRVADGTDDDWFAVTLEAGKTYRIEMGHNSRLDDGTNLAPRMHGIYDEDGHSVDGAFSGHGRMYFTATQDATYYVAAGAARRIGNRFRRLGAVARDGDSMRAPFGAGSTPPNQKRLQEEQR